MSRGAAAARGQEIRRRRVAAPPRPRRGYSLEMSRGRAAATTWIFRGDGVGAEIRPTRRCKSLCAQCGHVDEIPACGAVVAVGATNVACRSCGGYGSGDPAVEQARLRALATRRAGTKRHGVFNGVGVFLKTRVAGDAARADPWTGRGPAAARHVDIPRTGSGPTELSVPAQVKRDPTDRNALAFALVGKYAHDDYRAARDAGATDAAALEAAEVLKAEALDGLTRSARYGVAASAAALGELYYQDATDAQAAHESSADPDKAAIAPTVAAALNLSRNWYQLALETKGDLSLLDDERAKVMSMPSVRSVLGCHGTFQVS